MKPGKRFFITGASGFIGSHLAGKLAEEEGASAYLLIRPCNGFTAGERWKRIAEWLGLSEENRKRVADLSGDLN